MSGICGIFHLDGAPVEQTELRRMVERSAFLGPDGIYYWMDGPVGFAYLALHTTAESLREQQPLVAQQDGLVLVADARVDNRDELTGTLTAKGCLLSKDSTDAELILAAYQVWGEECPYYILGDFAFVVWDAEERKLVCARDPFGVRPLFYAITSQVFLFASMARQILAHGSVPARLDERAIAYYLTGKPYDFLTEGTFFEGIRRVHPAHTLSVTLAGGIKQKRYWDIDRNRQLHYKTDEAYAEELLYLLRQSIIARSRSHRPVAVLTSGGIDSSSIASLLGKICEEGQRINFKIVSATYGASHPCDESSYVRATALRYGVDLHFVDALQHVPLCTSLCYGQLDEPSRYWNDPLWDALFATAQTLGCRAVLLGRASDCLFTVHQVLFADLLRQGRLSEIIREIRSIPGPCRGQAVLRILKQWARAFSPMWLRRLYRLIQTRWQPRWINLAALSSITTSNAPELRWGVPDRGFQFAHQAERYYAITDWLYPVHAASHQLAIHREVELRDPYLERRLVEFVFALPAEQLYFRTTTKRVLRKATGDILVDEVRNRWSQTSFGIVLQQGLIEWIAGEYVKHIPDWLLVRYGYLNAARLSEALYRYRSAPNEQMAAELWKPILLEQWLQSVRNVIAQ